MPYKKGFLSKAPFPVTYVQQVAAATMLVGTVIFTNQAGSASAGGGEYYEILAVEGSWDVVSASGTVDVRVVPTGVALTAGASALTATLSTAAGVRTVTKGALVSNKTTRTIPPGGLLTIVQAGTLTGLVGLCVTVWLQPTRGVRTR